jgi:two-component system LytT family response regulator
MIRSIIIDDEQHCIDRLQQLLNRYHADDVDIIGTYLDATAGEEAIRQKHPDLVFLDIHIGRTTGFDILRCFESPSFSVIFTTAYDKYAVEAFRFSAIDYLLKPIDADHLAGSLARMEKKMAAGDMSRKLDVLSHNLQTLQGPSRRICIPVLNGLEFIQVGDIIRCQADVNYTTLFLKDRKKLTVAKTLGEFEHLLENSNFFRVHNSHLVNLAYIKSYQKGKGGLLTLSDLSQVEVSTRRKEEFLQRLASL